MYGLNAMRSWLVISLTAGILWALGACCCTGGLDDERIPLVSPDPVPPGGRMIVPATQPAERDRC